ncbi:MAG: hypothetical protein IT428_17035 [Planctomycetaceae bacterium]|nr:hypothetical protein [Planctomycetaceae bacterium]
MASADADRFDRRRGGPPPHQCGEGRVDVTHRLQDAQCIAPDRVITIVGFDKMSLKKRRRLYVTILTDLSSPKSLRTLAVSKGRDEAAGRNNCVTLILPRLDDRSW